jgi:hypothetical protein
MEGMGITIAHTHSKIACTDAGVVVAKSAVQPTQKLGFANPRPPRPPVANCEGRPGDGHERGGSGKEEMTNQIVETEGKIKQAKKKN